MDFCSRLILHKIHSIFAGGVLPNIHATLLPKKTGKHDKTAVAEE